ncbi:MAG: hypothetical protein ACOCZ8_03975 [Bacteroidota bacterium]
MKLLIYLLPFVLSYSLHAQSFEDFLGRFPHTELPYSLPVEELTVPMNQKLMFGRVHVSSLGKPLRLGPTEMRKFFPQGLENEGEEVYYYPILRLSEPAGDVHGAIIGAYAPGGDTPWTFYAATYTTRGKQLASQKILALDTVPAPMTVRGEIACGDLTHFTTTRRVIIDRNVKLSEQELMATRPYAVMQDWTIEANGLLMRSKPRRIDLNR